MLSLPAFLAPLAGTAGAATGAASTLSTIATIGSAVGGIVTPLISGKMQSNAYKAQAQEEERAFKDREIMRNRDLIESLASQNISAAARGVSAFRGTPASMAKEDMRRASYSGLSDRASTDAAKSSLKMQGKASMFKSLVTAGESGLNTAYRIGQRGK